MFLMTWYREDRTLKRVFDTYVCCDWPLHETANQKGDAEAMIAMIDGYENLPEDVKQFCNAFNGMHLRRRYGNDVTGPYLVNDVDDAFDRDTLEEYLDTLSDAELNKFHYSQVRFSGRR